MRRAAQRAAAARIVGYVVLGAATLSALAACLSVLAQIPRLGVERRSNKLVEKAQELSEQGQPEAALAAAEEAVAVAPRNPRARWEVAMHLIAWQRLDEAVVQLRRVVEARPTDAGAARKLGETLALSGATAEAAKWLAKSVEFDRSNGLTWAELASVQADIGDAVAARRSAEKAEKLAPNAPAARYALGQAYRHLGDEAGAAEAYREALRLSPTFVDAMLGLAAVARAEKRNDEALQHLQQAVAVAPTRAPAWTALGITLLDLGRSPEAAQAFTRALQLDNSDSVARAGLAKASE